jgi:hypothetical protein
MEASLAYFVLDFAERITKSSNGDAKISFESDIQRHNDNRDSVFKLATILRLSYEHGSCS